MSSDNGHKLYFDSADLTFVEHAEAMNAADAHKDEPSAQTYVLAAMVWQLKRREDPTFTYEQALGMKFSDLEMAGTDDVGKVLDSTSGSPAPLSAVPGESVPAP